MDNDFEKAENPEVTLITGEEEETKQKPPKKERREMSFLAKLLTFLVIRFVVIFIFALTILYFALRTVLFVIPLALSLITLFKVESIKKTLLNQWRHFRMSLVFCIGAFIGIFNIGVGIGVVLAYFLITKGKDLDSDFMRSLKAFLQRHSSGEF